MAHVGVFSIQKKSLSRIYVRLLPTVHLVSVRKSTSTSFRKPCQCYSDCETREKGEGQKVMSYFPSYSQWLAERANSLEGLKRWMHEMAGWRGKEREREREREWVSRAQRGRRVCGGMIWRLSNGITGKRFSHGSLSSTTVRHKTLCPKLLHALLAQDHYTESDFKMCWLILLISVNTYCAHATSYSQYRSRLHLCPSCNIPTFLQIPSLPSHLYISDIYSGFR